MPQNSLSVLANSRRTFVGKTDYYARFSAKQPAGTIQEAINGVAPYDVTQGLISHPYREDAIARLERYRNASEFYRGEHFSNPYDDGELKVVANYCKKVVDVAVSWFVADGWNASCKSGNEQVAELLNTVWEHNNRTLITEGLCQFSAITGDAFLYVTVQTKDSSGRDLPPDQWTVGLNYLNPSHCFPFWHPNKPGVMTAMLIQYPAPDEDGSLDGSDVTLYSLLITADKWKFWRGDDLVTEEVNPFGEINVVHFPNFVMSESNFGQSDIHHVIPVNEEYNITLNKIRKIIAYHAEPTTVIFGCKVGDLQKGSRKVWSGLPTDAKVENLELQSDLAATQAYLDKLELHISQFSSTPQTLLQGDGLRVSNTSGLAMQMMFQPIIEKTKKRRITYTAAFKKVNRLILKAHEAVLGISVAELADEEESLYESFINYSSPLPRDEQAELDAASKKVALGVWSKAEATRRLSGVKDFERLALELAADERYKLAFAKEMAVATQGSSPNLASVFLSSSFLSEELEAVVKQSPSTDEAEKDPEEA